MIYFDSAATTLQKPESVYAAVQRTMRACASVGAAAMRRADAAARVVYACRTEAAELFDAVPEQVVFTMNATHGLNIALRSLGPAGGASCCPAWSTMPSRGRLRRSVRRLKRPTHRRLRRSGCSRALRAPCGRERMRRCARMFQMSTAMCCRVRRCRAVPGTRRPARHRCLAVRGNAAGQPARTWRPSSPCRGTRGCMARRGRPAAVRRGGGAAAAGRHGEQFARSEHAGFPAGPPRGGHAQRLRHRRPAGWPALCARAAAGRAAGGGARTHGPCGARPSAAAGRGGVHGAGAERRSVVPLPGPRLRGGRRRLAEAGIAVRAGLHCAPMAHRSGGTLETGTVRVSFSAFNTSAEVRQFLQVCRTAFLPG